MTMDEITRRLRAADRLMQQANIYLAKELLRIFQVR